MFNINEDEGENVEVERIDDPAEEHGPEGAPLITRDLAIPGQLCD
jgi:hypothetical protein